MSTLKACIDKYRTITVYKVTACSKETERKKLTIFSFKRPNPSFYSSAFRNRLHKNTFKTVQ